MNEQAPIRILLVDDHPLMRRGMRDLLAMEDDLQPVGEAGTGEEALRLVDELDPDLILLDLNMPGMDGLETLQRLREAKVDARIILFTVSDDQSHVLEALRQGADGYLLKDMDPEHAHKEEMGFDRNRKISTHIFRHTHISKLAEIGVPLHVIQRRVGHASEKITREIYLHITNKMKSDTKDLLELL